MAITIQQKDRKWRVIIQNEEWEFESLEKAKECLLKLIEFKDENLPNNYKKKYKEETKEDVW
jgi:hypothetical protein